MQSRARDPLERADFARVSTSALVVSALEKRRRRRRRWQSIRRREKSQGQGKADRWLPSGGDGRQQRDREVDVREKTLSLLGLVLFQSPAAADATISSAADGRLEPFLSFSPL